MQRLLMSIWVCLLLVISIPKRGMAQVNNYNFTQTSSLNPSDISGTTYIVNDYIPTTDKRRRLYLNDITSSALTATGKGFPIGFKFWYDGQIMNSFGVSSNGYIQLGDSLQGITMLNDSSFFSFYEPHPDRKNIIAGFMRKSYKLPNFSFNAIRIKYGVSGYPGEQILSISYDKTILITQSPLVLYNPLTYIRLYQYGNKVEVVNNSDISTTIPKDTALVGILGSTGMFSDNFATRKVSDGINTWKTSVNGTALDGYCEYNNTLRPVHTSAFNPLGIAYSWSPASFIQPPQCPVGYFKQTLPGNPKYIKNVSVAYILSDNAIDVELNQTLFWSPEFSDSPLQYDVYLGIDSLNLFNIASNLSLNSCQLPTLSANTKYYYYIIARNAYGTSPSSLYSFTTGQSIQYCTPLFSGNTAYQNFTLNTLSYNYAGTSDPQAEYPASVYTTTLKKDTSYAFHYTAMTGVPCFTFRLWIDFNQNGILNDAGEYFAGNNFTIPIPHTAIQGPTKMRIGITGTCAASIPNPCLPDRYQDFIVTIGPSSACHSFTINPAVIYPSCYDENNGSISVNPAGGLTPYTFSWLKNNTGYTEITGTAANIHSGTYQCKITDANNCILQTQVIPIHQPLPIIPDTNLVSGTITATATGGTAPYQFEYSNSIATYNSNPPPGTYTLTVTDDNDCVTQLPNIVVPPTTITSVYEIEKNILTLYPNPSHGLIKLSTNEYDEQDVNITITDMNGSLIKQQHIIGNETLINLSQQNKGIYFLKIESLTNSKIIKLILQ